jgi:hypothetical protein
VARPAPGAGAPKPKNGMVTIVYADDVLSFPQSDANGVKTTGNLVLKDGAKMYQLYMTDDSQKASHSIEGESDTEGFLKKFEGTHPGDELEASEFVQNSIGQGIIALYSRECGLNSRKLIGTPCNPLYLKGEFVDDKDGSKHTFNFEQRRRDRNVAKFYDGEVVYEENYVAATTAIDLTDANGPVVKLPAVTVVDTDVSIATLTMTNAQKKIITLIGGGGSEPETLAAVFSGPVTLILDNGTDWVALKDAVINLQVYDAGATTYLIEVSRG